MILNSDLKLVDRIDVGNIDSHEALIQAASAFNDNPFFCIPNDALTVYSRYRENTEVILLGATPFSHAFITEAHDSIRIVAAVDDYRAASGDLFHGLPIITSEEMVQRASNGKTIALSGCRYDHSRRYFKSLARDRSIPHLNFEQGMRLLGIEVARDHRLEDWGKSIATRLPEYLALGKRMVDDYSRYTLYNVLLSHLTCNPEWSLHAARPYCTLYFRSGLWSPSHDERFLDCGASLGESTSAFIDATDGRFNKIWMVEPDRYNVETLKKFMSRINGVAGMKRLALHSCAVGERDEELVFSHQGGHGGRLKDGGSGETVPVRRIDDLLDDMPTVIKMDIEGAELGALRGATECIRHSKPKMAISAYHRATDLIDLASFVFSLQPEYKLGIRHHTEERWDTCLYFH